MKQQITSHQSAWQFILLMSFLNFFPLSSFASDDNGYYWYHNHVSAYPTGKGLVYATHDKDNGEPAPPTQEQYKEEMTVKFCSTSSSESLFVFNQPAEGYRFNGWFSVEDGKLGDYITKDSIIGGFFEDGRLVYTHSDDDNEEHYNEIPDNDFTAAFGRVNYEAEVDNMEELKEQIGDILGLVIHFSLKYMDLSISNPCNEIGDTIVLHTEPMYIDYKVGDSGDNTEIENYRLEFTGWTDSEGNTHSGCDLKATVKGPNTYTAHYVLTFPTLLNIKSASQGQRDFHPHYDLQGRPIQQVSKPSLIIKNGKKVLSKDW